MWRFTVLDTFILPLKTTVVIDSANILTSWVQIILFKVYSRLTRTYNFAFPYPLLTDFTNGHYRRNYKKEKAVHDHHYRSC